MPDRGDRLVLVLMSPKPKADLPERKAVAAYLGKALCWNNSFLLELKIGILF
jgi:hypothetical protein